MTFTKLSEKDLLKLKKKRSRMACFNVVEQIEKAGIKVDLTKYNNNIGGFIDAIRHYQEEIPDPTPEMDADAPKPEDFEDPEEYVAPPIHCGLCDTDLKDDGSCECEKEDKEEVTIDESEVGTLEDEIDIPEVESIAEPTPEPIVKKIEKPKYKKPAGLQDWTEVPTEKAEGFVRQLYLRYLHREPDEGGKSTYVTYLKSGMPREQAINAFKRSPEYRELQAKMRV